MGHRLSKIYTRTGDSGTTGLGNGKRVDKDHPRVEAIGAVDELNSVIGLLLVETLPEEIDHCLITIQHRLFDLGGELSVPDSSIIDSNDVKHLENVLDQLNADLEPLKEFILPGGTRSCSLLHLSRTICRRAERRVFTLAKQQGISNNALCYLNRLSDLLFVMARYVNKQSNQKDVLWQPKQKPNISE